MPTKKVACRRDVATRGTPYGCAVRRGDTVGGRAVEVGKQLVDGDRRDRDVRPVGRRGGRVDFRRGRGGGLRRGNWVRIRFEVAFGVVFWLGIGGRLGVVVVLERGFRL